MREIKSEDRRRGREGGKVELRSRLDLALLRSQSMTRVLTHARCRRKDASHEDPPVGKKRRGAREAPGDLSVCIKVALSCKSQIVERVNRIYAKSAPRGSRFSFVTSALPMVPTVATAKRAIRWSGVPCQYWYCRVCYRVARCRARARVRGREREGGGERGRKRDGRESRGGGSFASLTSR